MSAYTPLVMTCSSFLGSHLRQDLVLVHERVWHTWVGLLLCDVVRPCHLYLCTILEDRVRTRLPCHILLGGLVCLFLVFGDMLLDLLPVTGVLTVGSL
jgi:hypothetical protein